MADKIPVKPRVLLVYDYFSPAFKAGGPIQSLVNLVQALHDKYEFYVLAGCYEYGENKPMPGIRVNEWNNWNGMCSVYYWRSSVMDIRNVRREIQSLKPDIVFINGIYSPYFNILPLYLMKGRARLVISARGMLHAGALSQKSFKKKLFLFLLEKLNLLQGVIFHATDEQESLFIKKQFGSSSHVTIAGNFPRRMSYKEPAEKQYGSLKMASIALISPMKNHLHVLEALLSVKGQVKYVIAGPVKDADYWKACCAVINSLPENIKVEYLGPVEPAKTTALIEDSDIIVLPSKSENFGHAILEALQVGRPVITTDQTPWKDLQISKAGFTLGLQDLTVHISKCLQYYTDLAGAAMQSESKNARSYAEQHIHFSELNGQYESLFGKPRHFLK